VPIVMIIITVMESLRPADVSETRHLP
jgi:hypothetical protein